MAVTFTEQELALGKAMGLSNVSSQSDLNQIKAFAAANGVKNLNSANDLNALLPKVQAPKETSPGSNVWTNPNDLVKGGSYAGAPIVTPLAPGTLPKAAADGTSSAFDFQALLMQQQASLAAQNQAFQLAQQQFAQQQALQQAEMTKQLQAAQLAAAPPTAAAQTSGWKPASGAKSTLESLLLGTEAVTGAVKAVVA
jgi:hypothetical protein